MMSWNENALWFGVSRLGQCWFLFPPGRVMRTKNHCGRVCYLRALDDLTQNDIEIIIFLGLLLNQFYNFCIIC